MPDLFSDTDTVLEWFVGETIHIACHPESGPNTARKIARGLGAIRRKGSCKLTAVLELLVMAVIEHAECVYRDPQAPKRFCELASLAISESAQIDLDRLLDMMMDRLAWEQASAHIDASAQRSRSGISR